MKALIITAMLLAAPTAGFGASEEILSIWKKQCASCHGDDGKGDTKMGRKTGVHDYTDPKVQAKFTDEQMFKAIKEGVTEKGKVKMKPAKDVTDEQIRELVAYIRSFCKKE